MDAERYDPQQVEPKWVAAWEELGLYRADEGDTGRTRFYALDMFPYPSGALHMGHLEAFSGGDVIARLKWMQGYNVLHPIGWDAFGLPAENAAIRRGIHPKIWTYQNIDAQRAGFRRLGISFDWTRALYTCDPDYYRWTQWLFLRFFERGLAYRKASPVNWCPNDQTVLANEQVINGHCERCDALVEKRELTQWFFKITEYAEELLEDLDALEATWPTRSRKARNPGSRSVPATSRSASGCSGARTKKVAPNSVSGRVVNTRTVSPVSATWKSTSAPSLRPIQLRC